MKPYFKKFKSLCIYCKHSKLDLCHSFFYFIFFLCLLTQPPFSRNRRNK
jgi:hypothetical protein